MLDHIKWGADFLTTYLTILGIGYFTDALLF